MFLFFFLSDPKFSFLSPLLAQSQKLPFMWDSQSLPIILYLILLYVKSRQAIPLYLWVYVIIKSSHIKLFQHALWHNFVSNIAHFNQCKNEVSSFQLMESLLLPKPLAILFELLSVCSPVSRVIEGYFEYFLSSGFPIS